jgi:hypothetical protein
MNKFSLILGISMLFTAALATFAPRATLAAVYTTDLAPGLCMDVNVQNKQLDIWNCHGGPNQDFSTNHSTGQIKNQGQCVDMSEQPSGNALKLTTCKISKSQHWTFDKKSRAFKNQAGYCMDISAGRAERGTPLVAWKCADQANQKWQEGKVIAISNLSEAGISSEQQQTLRTADQKITSANGNLGAANGANQVSSGKENLIAAGDGKFFQTNAH